MIKVTALQGLLTGKQLEPFIRYIRFPFFKNLQTDTRIDFDYPITALVGANGSSKSSVLRALFGCPGNYNLGDYWFSTKIDPILETEGEGRNRFIYGYFNDGANAVVEIIKTRIRKAHDPDYWDPSRPLASDNMASMPAYRKGAKGRSETRWKTISKPVLLIDFRQHLSAFDKAFHHYNDAKAGTRKERKAWIKGRVNVLKKAIDAGGNSYDFYGKNRLHENRVLSDAEIAAINKILQKEYDRITLVRHSLFDVFGDTAILETNELRYTEAFAGSGEFAVVSLVARILNCEDKSLILLDEPEVSLHPGAQERLVEFLEDQVIKRKHQVVYATHSPSMIRRLPANAIKVFLTDKTTGKFSVPSQSATPDTAFFYIGEPLGSTKTVVVEDALAAEFIKRAKRLLGPALMPMLAAKFYPGGSETLWAHFAPTYAAENRSDILIYFDGDKAPSQPIVDPRTIPEAQNENLGQVIQQFSGVKINFHPDGSKGQAKEEQRIKMQRAFIGWSCSNVDFLPGGRNPEALLWQIMHQDAASRDITDPDAKRRFAELARKERGLAESEQVESNMILETQIRRLALLDRSVSAIEQICERLTAFAERV